MTREELIEKMCEADANGVNLERWEDKTESQKTLWRRGMAAALDVAVGGVLGEPSTPEIDAAFDAQVDWSPAVNNLIRSRRSRYLKPKSDPAVDKVTQLIECWNAHRDKHHVAELIVAAVRNADKGASNGR